MSAKKQIADIENIIVLLEDKIERLEDEHATMKQMISMQNALIDNLQMMVKMMALTPSKHQVVHIGGNDTKSNDAISDATGAVSGVVSGDLSGGAKVVAANNEIDRENNKKLKHRMSRVF